VLPDLADKPERLVFEQAVGSADTVVTDWALFLSNGGKRLVLVFGDDSDLAGHLCTAPRGVFVRNARGPWQSKMWETALVGDVHKIPKTPLGRQKVSDIACSWCNWRWTVSVAVDVPVGNTAGIGTANATAAVLPAHWGPARD